MHGMETGHPLAKKFIFLPTAGKIMHTFLVGSARADH
jgi:hypothetical protein